MHESHVPTVVSLVEVAQAIVRSQDAWRQNAVKKWIFSSTKYETQLASQTAPYDKGTKSSEEQRTCEPPIQSPVEVTVCGENNETTGLGPPSTIIDNNYYMLLFLSTIRHAECYRYARNISLKKWWIWVKAAALFGAQMGTTFAFSTYFCSFAAFDFQTKDFQFFLGRFF